MGINLGSLEPTPTDIKQEALGVPTPAPAPVAEPAPAPAPVKIELPLGVEKVDRGGGNFSLNLDKGISLDLDKVLPALKRFTVGLGWDPACGATMDLDVFAFTLHNGKVQSAADVIYFKARTAPGITLSEDNTTGQGEGDDETIKINLDAIAADVTEVAVFVNIYNAAQKGQNFGMVKNSYCRIINDDTNKEEAIYVLNESDAALYNAFHFVNLKRNATGWALETVGKGRNGDINTILNSFC